MNGTDQDADDRPEFKVGETATYTVTVTNEGGGAEKNDVIVVDTLPAEVTYVSNDGDAQL